MLDGAIVVPVMQMLYTLLYEFGAFVWSLQRALLLTGYTVMAITDWLIYQAFTPLLASLGAQTGVLLAPIFTIALLVLAGTYLMGVFLRLHVVEFKSAVVWFLAALVLFEGGPQLYQGVEDMRRGISSGFYQEGLNVLASGGGALAALDQVGHGTEASMPEPVNQFGLFIVADQYIDGLDVAMSYIGADGYDVVAPVPSPHPIERLPWTYITGDGYFDYAYSGTFYESMTKEERDASLSAASQGIGRMALGSIISVFGVLEQLIHLALTVAMGLAFASAFVAILFAFFKHTEVLVWSVLNLVIELFIQSVLMSLILSLIISFVLVGAVTGNAVVTLGTALVGLVLVIILLLAALKAIWNGVNRLFGAMSQVTGGTIGSPGQVAVGTAGLAMGTALGATGAGMALARGTSGAQAAGIALGDNPTLMRSAYMTSLMPGLRETRFGQLATGFAEGALARSALGPVAAGALLPARDTDARTDSSRQVVQDYYRAPSSADRSAMLTPTFGATTAPRMAQVMDAHTEDEFLEIVDAVQAVRRSNPTLPASSPGFINAVSDRLPVDVSARLNPADLQVAITALAGSNRERERLTQTPMVPVSAGSQPLNPTAFAQAIGATIGQFTTTGQPAGYQPAAQAVAQHLGISGSGRPFGGHTAAVGNYVRQAISVNATPSQSAQVVTQVQRTGGVSDDLRQAIRANRGNADRRPDELNRALRSLEAAARALPQSLTPSTPTAHTVQPITVTPEQSGRISALDIDPTGDA